MRALLLTLMVLTASASCFRPRAEDPAYEPPRIEVENRYLGPVVVYLRSGEERMRLGMVHSNRVDVLRFPVGLNPTAGSFRLVADPVGGEETFISEAINIGSGTVVRFTIELELRYSHVEVR
jgi:hypothetical protein